MSTDNYEKWNEKENTGYTKLFVECDCKCLTWTFNIV